MCDAWYVRHQESGQGPVGVTELGMIREDRLEIGEKQSMHGRRRKDLFQRFQSSIQC